MEDLPPASCRKGVGKTEGTEDIGGDEIEDGTGGSCADCSGSIDPLIISDGRAPGGVRKIGIRYQRRAALFTPLGGKDGREEASILVTGNNERILEGTVLEGVVMVLLKRDGRVVESAHLRTSI